MSSVEQAYNEWAKTYDVVENKTRDLDKIAMQQTLSHFSFSNVLELGCGTGKNTEWLATKFTSITSVDFSVEMIAKAKEKIKENNVRFLQFDITNPWRFEKDYELITCNLILEHIKDLGFIFSEASKVLKEKGKFFISELHPFKQYTGSKARFEKDNETIILDCYTHHTSDFFNAAFAAGFECIELKEWFDNDSEREIPRLITFLFQKK